MNDNSSIKEECVCGTIFEVTGGSHFCSGRHEEFLKNHKACLDTRQIKMSRDPKEDYDIKQEV